MNRQTVSTQVADILRDMILTGALAPGEAVTHDQIATLVGVSTMPVREALLRLTHEGFIEAQENRSFRVAVTTVDDIRDAYWVHAELSGELVARACRNADDELLTSLDDINNDATLMDPGHISCWRFHGTLNDAARSPKLVLLLRQVTRFVPEHYYAASPEWKKRTTRSHRSIAAAVRHQDEERARELMVEHVQAAAQFLIQFFTDSGYWSEPTVASADALGS